MISVMGTFSAGKSSFINHYLGQAVQRCGNQAVDDKFTVICYGAKEAITELPGVALNADARFPFFQISEEIERLEPGEGSRVDAYLQLKTCRSEKLKGKIVIDSPGFDADSQRTATLRITDKMVDLSDLVLIFFDARHPEPGAMRDTLDLLVARTMRRPDANKFLYLLNQMDTTASEDNPEEVVAAWQRALSEKGFSAGRFYAVYNPDAAVPIADENVRRRYETKNGHDMQEIQNRIENVTVSRAYRIVSALENTAREIAANARELSGALEGWRRRVLLWDGIALGGLALAFLAVSVAAGWWDGLTFTASWWQYLVDRPVPGFVAVGVGAAVLLWIHLRVRRLATASVAATLDGRIRESFAHNTRGSRTIWWAVVAGWNRRARSAVRHALDAASHYMQVLNSTYTNPSGADDGDRAAPSTPK